MSFESSALTNEIFTSEWLFPILMVIVGAASLFFHRFLKRELQKNSAACEETSGTSRIHLTGESLSHFHLESILERFEQRQRISWLLMGVGVLWLSLGFVSEVVAKMQ